MSGTVLVVDDDAAIRTVVAQALKRAGHHVTTAASLAELDALLDLAVAGCAELDQLQKQALNE